ncbi:MAG TPA: hypothetical protein VGO03_16065 [Acidimicrobiia bacterium]|jgi:hypothetical protein
MRKTLVSVLLAGSLAAGGAVAFTSMSAGAATTTASTAASATAKTTPKAKHPLIRKAIRRAVVRISAKTIGVTQADLVQELKSGKSIADVANEHSVKPATVVSALVKAGDQELTRLAKNHRITAARAKKIAARLPALATKVVNKHFK